MRCPALVGVLIGLTACLTLGGLSVAADRAPQGTPSIRIAGGMIVATDGDLEIQLDPGTLAVQAPLGTEIIPAALPAFPRREFVIDANARTIAYEAEGLRGLLRFCRRTPRAALRPQGEGSYIPAAHPAWRTYLASTEWDTLEGLSMPFWGIQTGGQEKRVTGARPRGGPKCGREDSLVLGTGAGTGIARS